MAIESLWAFVANPVPGGPEIVVSVKSGPNPDDISPLIAYDPEVVAALIDIAQQQATASGVEIRMVEYRRTDNVRVLEPGEESERTIVEGDAIVLPPAPTPEPSPQVSQLFIPAWLPGASW